MKVNVRLNNRYALFGALPKATYDALWDYWSFSVPGSRFIPKVKDGLWDGRIRFLTRGRLAAGLFRATYADCAEKLGIEFDVIEEREKVAVLPPQPVTDPRYLYQRDCVDAMINAIPSGGGLVIAATGTGKTKIASDLMSRLPDSNVLFIVDQLNLLHQAKNEIENRLDCLVGVVGDGDFDPRRLTVATIQTLSIHRRNKGFKRWFESLHIVLVDEFHEMIAKRTFKVLQTISPIAVFGLTATLELTKKDVRYNAFAVAGPVIFTFNLEQGQKQDVLMGGCVLQLVFDRVDYGTLDYQDDYKINVVENDEKHEAARLITEYLIMEHDRHVLHLVERVAHLGSLQEEMRGIPFKAIFGKTKQEAKEDAVEAFEDEKIHLLMATRVMKKGVSVNVIDVIIDMAEMDDAVQKFGRGVRKHENNNPLFYIDFTTDRERGVLATRFTNALNRAGKRRITAFKGVNISVYRVKVHSVRDALKAVRVVFKKEMSRCQPKQKKLFK